MRRPYEQKYLLLFSVTRVGAARTLGQVSGGDACTQAQVSYVGRPHSGRPGVGTANTSG